MMPRITPDSDTAANRLIRQLLASLLRHAPQVALVSLSVLDPGDCHPDVPQPSYCLAIRPQLSKPLSAFARHMPPAPDWGALLPLLRDGRCLTLDLADRQINATPYQLAAFGDVRTLVCPAASPSGKLVGAIFLTFDRHDDQPQGDELLALMSAGVRAGGQIAAIVELARSRTTPTQARAAA